MTRIVSLAASLVAVAALAVGAAAAGAADRPPLADDVAARLGIPPEKLRDAFKAALTARIDAAVAKSCAARHSWTAASGCPWSANHRIKGLYLG